jgi:RNA polymerase sigma-70 factor (ECF subfamily)
MTARTQAPGPQRAWTDAPGLPHEADPAGLRDYVLRTARREVDRRGAGRAGADLLARQAAAGALAAIAANLGSYSRQAPFGVWAGKFAVAEVSARIARQDWRAWQPAAAHDGWDRLPADAAAELRRAADQHLSAQQRLIFAAVALDAMPVDVLALELGATRNAVYKALFEARRLLSGRLAGHGFGPWLDQLLEVTPGDAGCEIAFQELDRYVDAERRGLKPQLRLAGVAVHLGACAPCRQDYRGLADAVANPGRS